jgi:hypothetical protein
MNRLSGVSPQELAALPVASLNPVMTNDKVPDGHSQI